ncbi:MAG: hypothetical protein RIS09_560 [Actinomycetota bacterium]|jgi:polar amino acid transport system permease protein
MSFYEALVEYLPQLLPGLWVSLLLLVTLVVIGTPLAFVLAIGQRSRVAAVRWAVILVVEIARGIPSLILLYIVYFGLPKVGISFEAFTAAAIALAINYGGYVSQSIKSGIEAIPAGQREAAEALALGRWTILRFVVIPQSFKIITPTMLSWIIVYFQTTSIGFAIAVPELMSVAYSIAATNFQYLNIFLIAGALYGLISIPGSQLVARLERRRSTS